MRNSSTTSNRNARYYPQTHQTYGATTTTSIGPSYDHPPGEDQELHPVHPVRQHALMDEGFDTSDPEERAESPEQTAIQISTGTSGPSSSSSRSGTTNAVDAGKPTFISSKKELLPCSQELNSYTQPTNGRGSHKYWTPLFFYGEGEDENEGDAEAAGAQPPGSTNSSAPPAPTRTSATTRGTSVVAGLPSDPFGHEFSVEQDVMNRDCVEFCCGCKCGNRYHIKPKDSKQNALTEMYVTETSSLFQKLCCGVYRGLTFDIFYGGEYKSRRDRESVNRPDKKILELQKPFVCQICGCCCCDGCSSFCRPKFEVRYTAEKFSGPKPIGFVQDHFKCCGLKEELFLYKDNASIGQQQPSQTQGRTSSSSRGAAAGALGESNAEHVFTIEGYNLQVGFCCPCGDSVYDITDRRKDRAGNNGNTAGPRKVGNVTKKGRLFAVFEGDVSGCGEFQGLSPDQASFEEKSLIAAAALMIDLQHYEDRHDQHMDA